MSTQPIIPILEAEEQETTYIFPEEIPSPTPVIDKSQDFTDLLRVLNPIAIAGDTISQYLDYKYRLQVLESERARMRAEAKAVHHRIKATYRFAMKQLEEHKKTLDTALQMIDAQLQSLAKDRTGFAQAIGQMTKVLSASKATLDEKHVIAETITHLSNRLVDLGQQSLTCLRIMESTIKPTGSPHASTPLLNA